MDKRSRKLRRRCVEAMESGGRGHLPSALSLIEILRVLYDEVLRFRPDQPDWAERDRCVLSKGHGCLGLYAVLADKGFFPPEELLTYCRRDSILGGHPERGRVPGVEASTGALGHGLGIGIGMALAARLQHRDSRIFVITGDGEINEGAVWEGALAAAKHRLDGLTVIIDYNKMQSYGTTAEVLELEPLADKWRAFGFSVAEVDGHDVAALVRTFADLPFEFGQPSAIICHTVKGKGIAHIEGEAGWHHKSRISADEIAALYQALETG
ncbi:MAG: transketolase [Alphaproteobacteria bacterium]|nr:transketolase [Alphaproteobacteria bacterium]MDP6621170.1 transketolase [Alphaproteobacteria bacterium]